jgi:hypothetical protein
MATIDLEGLGALGVAHAAGKRLNCRSRQHRSQFAQVRASTNPTKPRHDLLLEIPQQVQTDQASVCGRDHIASSGIRHRSKSGRGIHHVKTSVDRQPQEHIVNRRSGTAHAGRKIQIVVLDVGEMRIEVEKSVVTFERFDHNFAGVQTLTALLDSLRAHAVVARVHQFDGKMRSDFRRTVCAERATKKPRGS